MGWKIELYLIKWTLGRIQMIREWKEKGLCWKYRPRQSPRRFVLLYYSSVRLQVWFWNAIVFLSFSSHFFPIPQILFPPSSFIISLIFISTFYLYARWLRLILVSSALPINSHVVTVRLKYTVHVSLLH